MSVQTSPIGLGLIESKKYLEACQFFKLTLQTQPFSFPDIGISLYQLLARDLDNPHIRWILAELFLLQDLPAFSLSEIETALIYDRTNSAFYQLLAKIYSRFGRHPQITALFEAAIELEIYDSSILDILPQIYLEERSIDKSIALYEKLIQRQPTHVQYHKILAELYSRHHQYEVAASFLERLVEFSPDSLSESIDHCEKIIKFAPKNSTVRLTLIRFLLKHMSLSRAIFHVRQLVHFEPVYRDISIQILSDSLSVFPDSPDLLFCLAELMIGSKRYTEGVTCLKKLMDMRHPDEALIRMWLETCLEAFPHHVMALHLITELSISQGDIPGALHYLDRVSDLSLQEWGSTLGLCDRCKSDPYFYSFIRGKILFRMGQTPESLALLSTLFATPFSERAKQFSAHIYQETHHHNKGIDLLRTCFPHRMENWELHAQMITIRRNSLAKQLTHLSTDSSTPEIRFSSGLIELQHGNMESAIQFFQSLSDDPSYHFKSQFLVGRCFLESGRFDLSRRVYERLIQQIPDSQAEFKNICRYFISINDLNFGNIAHSVHALEEILETDINFPSVRQLLPRYKQMGFENMRGKTVSGCFMPNGGPLHLVAVSNIENNRLSKYRHKVQTMSFAYSHANQGVDHLLKQNMKAAEDEFNLALQLDPHLTSAYCNLAMLFLLQNRLDDACTTLERARMANPDHDLVDLNMGIMWMLSDNLAAAESCFRAAYDKTSENAIAALNLGDLYFQQHRPLDAFDMWKKAASASHLFYLIRRRTLYLEPLALDHSDWLMDFKRGYHALLSGQFDFFEKTDSQRSNSLSDTR